jgi:serine protease Do
MKSLVRIVASLIVGGIIGFVIYAQWGIPAPQQTHRSDSVFVNNAYANQENQNPDQANDNATTSRHNAITRAVDQISPAVVSVNVLEVREYVQHSPFRSPDPFFREFFPELFKDRTYQEKIHNLGSGFIISRDGYILSNDHVVGDAIEIIVSMAGGKEATAELIGRDPTLDVSLIKVDADDLVPALLGNSDDIILGEWAIAVGNPFGLFEYNNKSTVTVGVISAAGRDFGEMDGRLYQDMIQTDAAINHGNSGGPLCNALGEVIGMNTFIYTGSRYNEGSVGIGFAIPINRIKGLLDDLKAGKNIDRDFWIGIKVQNLNDVISRKMDYNSTDGVLIKHIDRGSPAEKAGLQLGDIILEMEDSRIFNENDVKEIVYGTDLKVGDDLSLEVWRDGSTYDITMMLVSIRNIRR